MRKKITDFLRTEKAFVFSCGKSVLVGYSESAARVVVVVVGVDVEVVVVVDAKGHSPLCSPATLDVTAVSTFVNTTSGHRCILWERSPLMAGRVVRKPVQPL